MGAAANLNAGAISSGASTNPAPPGGATDLILTDTGAAAFINTAPAGPGAGPNSAGPATAPDTKDPAAALNTAGPGAVPNTTGPAAALNNDVPDAILNTRHPAAVPDTAKPAATPDTAIPNSPAPGAAAPNAAGTGIAPLYRPADCRTILGAGGPFARNKNFIPRDGQIDMALHVSEAIHQGQILIAEAGTGTGKTYAYLVPALLSGKNIVISTNSKPLQDQLIKKDLPEVFRCLRLPPSFMALKGFGNYLCRKKLHTQLERSRNSLGIQDELQSEQEFRLTPQILEQAEDLARMTEVAMHRHVPCCDFADLDARFSPEIVKQLGCNRNQCSGSKCRYNKDKECFGYCARERARETRVVVINHSLFFASLSLRLSRPGRENQGTGTGPVSAYAVSGPGVSPPGSGFSVSAPGGSSPGSGGFVSGPGNSGPAVPGPAPGHAVSGSRSGSVPGLNPDSGTNAAESSLPPRWDPLLPDYDAIIFDEAHKLPGCGREGFSSSLSMKELKELGDDLQELFRENKVDVKEGFRGGFKQLEAAFNAMHAYLLNYKKRMEIEEYDFSELKYKHPYDPSGRKPHGIRPPGTGLHLMRQSGANTSPDAADPEIDTEFRDLARKLYASLKRYVQFLEYNLQYDENIIGRMQQRLDGMAEVLVRLMLMQPDDPGSPDTGGYTGTARITSGGFSLTLTPLEIAGCFGEFLQECLTRHTGVILTSATLSVMQSFAKFRADTGIPEQGVQELLIPSHFDYDRHAALYISRDFPPVNSMYRDPSGQYISRELALVRQLKGLINSLDGGILFLATSRRALDSLEQALHAELHESREIYSQKDPTQPIDRLLEKFRRNGRAVLIGTYSLWEGVDVPGRALSLVIIDKLPFAPPSSPLFKARCDKYDFAHPRKTNNSRIPPPSFYAIKVPEAVIQLRQGAGRLIRHEDDCGILVICDPRLVRKTRSYGGTFLNSLPPMHRCSQLKELLPFLENARRSTAASPVTTDRAPAGTAPDAPASGKSGEEHGPGRN